MALTLTLAGLILLALLFSAASLGVFLAAVKRGQFDDLETPRHRLLADDDGHIHKERE